MRKLFRPNHFLSLHCLSAAGTAKEEELRKSSIGISTIANSCAAGSKSVCSPGFGDHAMYEVELDGEVVNRSQRDKNTELQIINC